MTSRLSGSLLTKRLTGCRTLSSAAAALAGEMRSQRVDHQPAGVLRRIEVEIEAMDPLAWLAAQPHGERVYFKNREASLALAGVGRCLVGESLADPRIAGCISSESRTFPETGQPGEPLFFTSRFFDSNAIGTHAPQWAGFDRSRVVLPRIELRRTRETTLAVHVMGDDAAALEALGQLAGECVDPQLPAGLHMVSDGDLSRWADAMDAALGAIASGSFEKVVLARTRGYAASQRIDPCAILWALQCEEPAAFHLMVEQSPQRAFVAASPERLFRRKGDLLHSEAVAGTCGRGPDSPSDDRLAGRMLASDKNHREHEIVIRRIEETLAPMAMDLKREVAPRIMRLRHVQHLITGLVAHLRPGVTDAAILQEIHPTPAVCGWPVEASREFIREHERMSRGLYSGVIGVVSASRSDFSVALRCAVIEGASMVAYSGAGIVRGSDSDAEWLETARKLESFDGLVQRAATGSVAAHDHRRLSADSAATGGLRSVATSS